MLDVDRLDALLANATAPLSGPRRAEAHAATRRWLVLACAALAASARGVMGVRSFGEVEARTDAQLALDVDATLRVLGVSPRGGVARGVRGASLRRLVRAAGPIETWRSLDERDLGPLRERGLSSATRRDRGAHATPSDLADALAQDALAALDDRAAPGRGAIALPTTRALDPACGGGGLLLALARAFVERRGRHADGARAAGGALRRHLVDSCLFGVDRDADAVDVARVALALWAAGCDGALPARVQITLGDALLDATPAAERTIPERSARSDAVRRDLASALVAAHFEAASERAARTQGVLALARRAASGDDGARRALADRAARGRAFGAWQPALGEGTRRSPGFDVVVMNPPFLGGRRVATVHGEAYAAWLVANQPGLGRDVDLAARFARAAATWCAPHGVLAMITTASLAARGAASIEAVVGGGFHAASLTPATRWAGVASVDVVRAILVRAEGVGPATLRGEVPATLGANRSLGFVGFSPGSQGFVLDGRDAQEILRRAPTSSTCLRPWLDGRDVARTPGCRPSRFVIDFGARTLEEAQRFAELFAIVAARVRRAASSETPDRRARGAAWWRWATPRNALRARLLEVSRCLVAPRVAKHLVFARVDADVAFSEQLVVIPRDDDALFALLSSRAHLAWARAHATSRPAILRYAPTRALATFPLPTGDVTGLRLAGATVHAARDEATARMGLGLIALLDRVHAGDPDVGALRAAMVDVERAVTTAYGWSDLARRAEATRAGDLDDELVARLEAENARRPARGKAVTALV